MSVTQHDLKEPWNTLVRSKGIRLKLRAAACVRLAPFLLPPLFGIMILWTPCFFSGGFLNWGDVVFPFFPEQFVREYYYIWDYYDAMGNPTLWQAQLPYHLFIDALHDMGAPLWVVNRIIFVLPLSGTGWFTYLLAGSLIKGPYARVSRALASVFSVLNPLVMLGNPKWAFSIMGVPLVLGLFVRGLSARRGRTKYAFLIAVSSLLLPIGDPMFVLLTAVVAALYLILQLVMERKLLDFNLIKFLLAVISLSFFVNMFWVASFITVMRSYDVIGILESQPGQSGHGFNLLQYTSGWAGVPWVSRLITQAPNQTLEYYSVPVVFLISFLLPALAYSALFEARRNKSVLSLSIIALIFTLFATTLKYPWFAPIYLYLWNHVPAFYVLRSPVDFLYVLTFVYAPLLGFALQMALCIRAENPYGRLKPIGKALLVFGLIALLLVNATFILGVSGSEYNPNQNHLPVVSVPEDYYHLRGYLSGHSGWGDRLLVLPWISWNVKYTWYDFYDMADIVLQFSPIPVIGVRSYGPPDGPQNLLISHLNGGLIEESALLMGELCVRYVLVHKDISDSSFHLVSRELPRIYEYLELFSGSRNYFERVMEGSCFELYELNDSYVAPMIFAVCGDRVYSSGCGESPLPSEFEMVDPTSYRGSVVSASRFVLIFNQQFDHNWLLFVNGERVSDHFETDELANAWHVDKTGYLRVELQYAPQSVVAPASMVSVTTLVFIFAYFVGDICLRMGLRYRVFRLRKGVRA